MKNILFIERSGLFKGGGQVSLLELIRHINRNSYKIRCLLGETGPLKDEIEKHGIECLVLPLPIIRLENIFRIIHTVRNISKLIRDLKIDILHSNDSRSHVYAGLASKLTRLPVFFHYRVSYSDGIYDRILPFFADYIITVSHATAKRFPWFTQKLFVVPNGVDVETFHPDKPEADPSIAGFRRKPLIGTIGRMGNEKGFEQAIHSIALLKPDYPEIGLILVGNGSKDEKEYLVKLCKELGVEKNILFLDSHPNLVVLIRNLDVYILLSVNEGLNRSILEAMACGKPVVATNVGGNPEIIDNNFTGILLKDRKPDTIAYALKNLLSNNLLMQSMGKESRNKIVEHYSIEEHVRCMETLFSQTQIKIKLPLPDE